MEVFTAPSTLSNKFALSKIFGMLKSDVLNSGKEKEVAKDNKSTTLLFISTILKLL
jgi:hypothetical protein